MTTRRKLVLALGAGALAPIASFAQQQPTKIFRIGFLSPTSAFDWASEVEALRVGNPTSAAGVP